MFSNRAILLIVALVIITCLALPAQSAVIRVKADSPGPTFDGASWQNAYHTITQAINVAAVGDELWVARGTYSERLTLKQGLPVYGGFAGTENSLTQRPAFPRAGTDANESKIYGIGQSVSVTMSAESALNGFTVTNPWGWAINFAPGSGNSSLANNKLTGNGSGGIDATDASPTIANCVIGPNSGYGVKCVNATAVAVSNSTIVSNTSGGIHCTNSTPSITTNTIDSNTGDGIYLTGSAGEITNNVIIKSTVYGIECTATSSPTIAGNTIRDNADSAIKCSASSTPAISNNKIRGNRKAVECVGSAPVLTNNSIVVNREEGILADSGSPVSLVGNVIAYNNQGVSISASPSTLTNNTIAGNTREAVLLSSGDHSVTNNILAFNGVGIKQSGTSCALSHNYVYGNSPNYSGLTKGATDVDNVDPSIPYYAQGQFHIQPDSPCRDAGDETAMLPSVDIDGETRVQDARVDVGADESNGTLWTGRIVYVDVSLGSGGDGTSWMTAYGKIADAMQDVSSNGGAEIWITGGIYRENLTVPIFARLYGGFGGFEIAREERDWVLNETIIDGTNTGDVLVAATGSTIDGFTIKNGGWGINCTNASPIVVNNKIISNSGAIRCYYSSPSVTNCVIQGNSSYGVYCDHASPMITSTLIDGYYYNGYNYYYASYGVYCSASSPTITGTTITRSNSAVYCSASSPQILDSSIVTNSSGIECNSASAPTITRNVVRNNSSYGINCSGSSPAITYNTIDSNGSSNISCSSSSPTISDNAISGAGYGINMSASSPTVTNNTVSGASNYGIYCATNSAPVIQGNRIENSQNGIGAYSNSTPRTTANYILGNRDNGMICDSLGSPTYVNSNVVAFNGKGVTSLNFGSPILTNNTIVYNTYQGVSVSQGSPKLNNCIVAWNGTGIIRVGGDFQRSNNCVFGNKLDYSGLAQGTTDIFVDPLLAFDKDGSEILHAGNFHQMSGSPCRNTGLNVSLGMPSVDIDGEARIQSATVDIGADESEEVAWDVAPRIIYVNTGANPGGDGTSWNKAYRKIGDAIADLRAKPYQQVGPYGTRGAQIWVSAGLYLEKITLQPFCYLYGGFAGNESDRTQRNASVNETIIDAANSGAVVTAANGSTVDGFTIRNAGEYGINCSYTSPSISNNKITGSYYSGIYVYYSSPVISNNTITGNHTYNYYWSTDQGGIRCDNAFPVIKDNVINSNYRNGIYCTASSPTISNNTINSNSGGPNGCGGVYCNNSSAPTITGNTINSNGNHGIGCENSSAPKISGNTLEANSSYGIGCYSSSNAEINGNTLTGNVDHGIYVTASTPTLRANFITFSKEGIGIYNCSPTVVANRIFGSRDYGMVVDGASVPSVASNVVAFNNRGVAGTNNASPVFANNTISYNTYEGVVLNGGTPKFNNNIVAFNRTGILRNNGGLFDLFRNNDVYGNAVNYEGISPGIGDISADPFFTQPFVGDLRVLPGSGCIDAGIADPVYLADVDFEGQGRVQGSRVDIGADESDGLDHTTLIRRVYVNTAAAPNGDGTTWATAYRKIGDALANVKASGGAEVWVAAGIYNEKLVMPLFCHMYGGFIGVETDRSQRNASVNETIIDAAKSGTVVTAANGCAIDGFTIRNAGDYGIVCSYTSPSISNNKITGSYYSGIYVYYSSPVISNNTITGNHTYNYYWSTDQGGIRCDNAFPVIKDNVINSNYRNGIYCTASSPTISNNTINSNSGGPNGCGGVYCNNSSAPTITGNTINSNGNHGIGCENSSAPKISGNTLEANSSYGIGCYSSSNAEINGNTLTGNVDHGIYVTASSPSIQRNRIVGSSRGIGAYSSSCPTVIANSVINNKNYGILLQTTTGTPSVASNIVGFNNTGIQTDDSAAQIANNTVAYNAYDAVRINGGTPALLNNILAFNLTGVYRTGGPIDCRSNNVYSNRTAYIGLATGVGDIDANPLFACDKIGDLHIQSNSPCRDVGVESGQSIIDVDGQERIQGGQIDLGADESDGTTYNIALRVIYVDVTAPLGGNGTSWATAYRKIGDALADVKQNGGAEIWVSWGNYSENLTLPPFAHLYGGFSAHETSKDQRNWMQYETIIDGGNKATTVTSTNATTIDGFTIRNGSGYGIDCSYATCTITHNNITGNRSGAIYCNACSPTIVDNTVTQNSGWAVYCTSAHPLISDNELTNNSSYGVYCTGSSSPTISKNNISGHSYGVMCDTASNPRIDENTIKSNGSCGVYCSNSSPTVVMNTISVNGSYGVYCGSSSAPIVMENIIDWNGDHGVYCSSSAPSIRMNRISSNSTGVGFYSCSSTNAQFQLTANTILNNRGWGVYMNASPAPPIASNVVAFNSNGIYTDASSILTNNTVAGNTGQGISLNGASPSIYNNIVANNSSGIVRVGGRFAAFNSNVFGNGASYTGMEPGVGDISADPMFASYAGGDFRLKGTSPCRNKGTNNALNVPDIDFAGGTRIEEGIVDIGADEYGGEPSSLRQLYVDTDVPVSGNGSTWQTAYKTITEAIEDVKRNWLLGGAEVWVAAGQYTENVSLAGGTMLYGGFAGNEIHRDQRNWTVNETIIDGGNKNHTVVGVTGSVIDGFTVRNGSGCGFYCPNGSPTISNNKITANRSEGIYCYYSSPYIVSNTITANSTYGVRGTGSQARLVSNIIGKHTSNFGTYWETSSAATLVNNTIAGNYYGVGMSNSSATLKNNIVAFNTYGVFNNGNGSVTPTFNCVYGNSSNYYSFTDPNGTQGNISVDPIFVDTTGGNYHLTSISPCRDTGDNIAIWPTEVYDVDGQSRIVGTRVDMGGDEFVDPGAKTSIQEIKRSANGTYADIDGVVVTAAFSGFFYVQAEGMYSGVRVDKLNHGLAVGKKVRVYGVISTTSDKELVITASFTQDRGTGSVMPIAMPNKSIGGGSAAAGMGQVGVADGVGLNNIGVLATTFGKYTYVNAQTFMVDDGSGVSVKCVVPSGVSIAPGWNYVSVTGVVSCEMVGGDVQRLIRVRSASDIIPR